MALMSKARNKSENGEKDSSETPITFVVGKTPRRVKVYLLRGDDWIDNGTGYCVGEMESGSNRPYFLVRNELDDKEIILKSFLEGTTQYQRQQETLIVWTDESGKDLALSFQESEGCADLCEFIIKVQQEHYSPQISLYYVIPRHNVIDGDSYLQNGGDITELITGPINYPECPTVDNLDDVLELASQGMNSQYTRSCILSYIIEEQYFKKLIDVFQQSEKAENLKNLHTLSEIVRTLILYNEAALFEDILSNEDKLYNLAGVLEYTAEFPTSKACYRETLREKKNFKVVIDVPLQAAPGSLDYFKKDFYLNFLKDVVLARLLDDQTLNTLSSLIYFNQVDIINYLKDSERNDNFMEKLFKIYDADESIETKRDGVRLIHQYVLIVRSLQSYQSSFFFSLVKSGLFSMIKFALQDNDDTIRVYGTELIVIIIEQDVSLLNSVDDDETIDNSDPPPFIDPDIRAEKRVDENSPAEGRMLSLKLSDDMTLILLLTSLLMNEKSTGLKLQAFEALRTLLSPNIACNSQSNNDMDLDCRNDFNNDNNNNTSGISGIEESNDINTNHYFKAFYSEVAPTLFANFIELAKSKTGESYVGKLSQDGLLNQRLCDLVAFCINEHDAIISKPFFLENNIILGIAKLLTMDLKSTLKLSALRCLKAIIVVNETDYCQYILDNDILTYFLKFFKSIAQENNLANSACLDFVEIILRNCDESLNIEIRQNFRKYVRFMYDREKSFFKNEITYATTGSALIYCLENWPTDPDDQVKSDAAVLNPKDQNLDSDEDFLIKHSASTPVTNDEMEDSSVEATSDFLPKHNDLFKGIEAALESEDSSSNGEKRPFEEDSMANTVLETDSSPEAKRISSKDGASLTKETRISRTRKKLSKSLKKRISSAYRS